MDKDFKKIYTNIPDHKANLILLVLASQNIETQVEKKQNRFDIMVEASLAEKALAVMETYHKENKWFRIREQLQQIPLSSFSSIPAFFVMGMLCFIHFVGQYYNIHERMVLTYGASALYILQGETYRAVTALFLHADLQHLMGNLAGLLIFAAPVIRLSGYGTGLFILLFCSTSGNLVNAHLHNNAHLSIGASTMVMAAAGLLCAFQALRKDRAKKMNSIMPIFAGTILVSLFSQGENTDAWAHVFGFLFGLGCGMLFFPGNRIILSPKKDLITLLITIFIIVSALLSSIYKV